ncbi:F-box domain containing protein [Pandoravirus salinus]|uniref:F-box domain containing protein n=1 Tax=Pandoravirus salinus TaxID=1349410 RepID=S4VWU9_9VIRU|nr:F-box domain [Pandoravirus salinus]AGO85134.2 F-box domain containing protein [Pandoravirus salinus]
MALDSLPDELLVAVLSWAEPKTVGRMAMACRRMATLCDDDALWSAVLIRILGLAMASAADRIIQNVPRKTIVRLLLSAQVDITSSVPALGIVRDWTSAFTGGKLLPPSGTVQSCRVLVPLLHVVTVKLLAGRAAAEFYHPLHQVRVWMADQLPSGAWASLRLVSASTLSILYPRDVPWWAAALAASVPVQEPVIAVHLLVINGRLGNLSLGEPVPPVVPACVARAAAAVPVEVGTPFPSAWYACDSGYLCHLAGCLCRP